jgi:hypothetical protein
MSRSERPRTECGLKRNGKRERAGDHSESRGGMAGDAVRGSVRRDSGLFFYKDDWLGGYDSWRRRLVRLGHISFFGLGLVNLNFAFSATALHLRGNCLTLASFSLLVGAVTMPICCFLAAWRKQLRHLFPIPVAAVATGVIALLIGWWNP